MFWHARPNGAIGAATRTKEIHLKIEILMAIRGLEAIFAVGLKQLT
jgi:hypothetical protein